MSLRDLHVLLGWILVISNGLVGAWALAAHWLPVLRHRALWLATGVAQVLILGQVGLGVLNMQGTELEMNGEHLFYGFVSAFTVGIIYSYRQQIEQWRYLLYGFGGLFLMGMGL
ncbi:MAG: hypothetical protein AAFO29_06880, partial [Actinomycetota bacterium]